MEIILEFPFVLTFDIDEVLSDVADLEKWTVFIKVRDNVHTTLPLLDRLGYYPLGKKPKGKTQQ